MERPVVKLKSFKEMPILAGHPWIFSNAIGQMGSGNVVPGELVEIRAHDGRFLGIGLYGAGESIKVRMISREAIDVLDVEFFVKRFLELDRLKRCFLPEKTDGYRLVYADADYLPGLIVDRYDEIFVFQIHTAGMERYRKVIVEALNEAFDPKGIVERSDVEGRKQEGLKVLEPVVHFWVDSRLRGNDTGRESDGGGGDVCEGDKVTSSLAHFMESGIKFYVDVIGGQKTGFFLDQREARRKVSELAKGRRVLNLFSYTGAFSLYATNGGAESVVSVDVSESAIEIAKKNFELNDLSGVEFVAADVFDYLRGAKRGEFDFIICDPPAFAKAGYKIEQAKKAYGELNQKCLELLEAGGILVTSSCSGRLVLEDFRNILKIAAGRAGKNVRVLDVLGQALDHTDRLSFPEGRYLKTLVLEVI